MRKLISFGLLILIWAALAQAGGGKIFAYYPFWVSYSQNKALADLPLARLDQLTYAFAQFDRTGQLQPGDEFADLNKTYHQADGSMLRGNYALLKSLKTQYPQLKTALAVGGWNYSAHFSTVLGDPVLRQTAVASTLAFLQQHGFDGIEVDWRYPGVAGRAGNSVHADDGKNLALFIAQLRRAKPDLLIGMTAGVMPEQLTAVPWASIAPQLDYVMLIATDFTGAWSHVTGHKSPLYAPVGQLSIDVAVNTLQKLGLPLNKLALMTPSHGMSFLGVGAEHHGLGQIPRGVSVGSWDNEKTGATGLFGQDEIASLQLGADFQSYWDDIAQANYFYSASKQQFITIETARSLTAKLDYIAQRQLLGLGLWELTSDASAASLLRQIELRMRPPQAYQNDLLWWWRYHPAWIELVIGAVLGLAALTLFAWLMYRRRLREQQYQELKQVRELKHTVQLLPAQLGQLRQLSLAKTPDAATEFAPLEAIKQWSEACDRIAWQLAPLLPDPLDANDDELLLPPLAKRIPNSQRIAALSQLTQRLSEQRSLEKMLEVTLAFLADDPLVSKVQLQDLDDEAEVQTLSAIHRNDALSFNEGLDDYCLQIEFKADLSAEDRVYYHSVAEQVRIVRRSLYELGRQPQLLAELYEIASRRDKLHYIRADKGYSAIYAQDLAAPSYITLRLRAIRLYFDEHLLLQVHRSYLINPKKVVQARKRGREGWDLQLGGELIPISRQYLPRIRQDYPQWFADLSVGQGAKVKA